MAYIVCHALLESEVRWRHRSVITATVTALASPDPARHLYDAILTVLKDGDRWCFTIIM